MTMPCKDCIALAMCYAEIESANMKEAVDVIKVSITLSHKCNWAKKHMHKTVTICEMGGVEPMQYEEIDPEAIQELLIEITRCANGGISTTDRETSISESVQTIEIKEPM